MSPVTGSTLSAQSLSALFASNARHTAFYKAVSPAVFSVAVQSYRRRTPEAAAARRKYPFGGTAFLIDPDGYLLTSSSLVVDAGRLLLTAADGREYRAGVVGTSPAAGVALLRMVPPPRAGVPYLRFAKSAEVDVGDVAMTLGNPYAAIQRTGQVLVSKGAVSGIYQVDGMGSFKGEVFETDAAVNPGIFGGPLLNAEGRVIGVLTDAISLSRWLGTAIPIDPVKALLPELRARRTPGAGDVGFDCVRRTVERVRARITEVASGTAAHAAGLRVGDEIVEFGGRTIRDYEAFSRALSLMPPGSTVNLTVLRFDEDDGESVERLVFPVGKSKEPDPAANKVRLGLRFQEGNSFLEVQKVEPGTPAAEKGIMPGDLLMRVDGKSVSNMKQLKRALAEKKPGARVKLKFRRDGWEKIIRFDLLPLRRL